MTGHVVTAPGVYDMDEATYHSDPVPGGSLSCSGAKLLLPPSCPARYAWERKNPAPATKAMELGTAAHREVLGTGWAYAVGEWESYTTRAAQQWAAEQRAAGVIPLKPSEREQIVAMAAAIRAHPTAHLLLQAGEVLAEKSLFWQDPELGIWLRQRMDAIRLPGRVYVTDFKTAASADPEEFARAAARYLYHWQAAWYPDGVTHVLGDADPAFVFVVQEKTPPYLVGIYELDAESMEAGMVKIAAARRVYAECQASGEWPGYQRPEEIVTKIRLPRWAL